MEYTSLLQCTATCGDGVIRRDVVCMKKVGSILAVVSEDNCLQNDRPSTDQQCQRPACQPRWYMTDWSQVRLLAACSDGHWALGLVAKK